MRQWTRHENKEKKRTQAQNKPWTEDSKKSYSHAMLGQARLWNNINPLTTKYFLRLLSLLWIFTYVRMLQVISLLWFITANTYPILFLEPKIRQSEWEHFQLAAVAYSPFRKRWDAGLERSDFGIVPYVMQRHEFRNSRKRPCGSM